MKNKNILIAALVLTAGGFTTQATAGCDEGIALVNPLNNMLEITGIDAGNGEIIDAMVELANGELIVRGLTPGNSINPSNRFNPLTSQVELDCVISGPDTLRGTLNVLIDGNDTKLQVAEASTVFDVSKTRDWNVDFNHVDLTDEVLMINTLNRSTLAGALGNWEASEDQISFTYSFNDFTTTLNGTVVAPGRIEGPFNHRERTGKFTMRPAKLSQTVGLNNDRFQLSGVWTNDTGSGPADVMLETGDSAVFFYFSDPDNVDARVRVFDGCAINDHYWVSAAVTTNVAYTFTITDTSTGTEKTYNSPLGNASPAITDTEAFANCP